MRARLLSPAVLAAALAVLPAAQDQRYARPASSAPASRVTGVRFWSLGDTTRIAIEVSTEFSFKSDRLANPDRLFFDIEGARPGLGQRGISTIPVGDGQVRQIRVAETQPGTTRVVIDLEGQPDFSASQLSSPERLMIEVRSRDATVPALTPGTSSVRKIFEAPERADVATTEQPRLDTPPQLPAEPARLPAVLNQTARITAPPPADSHKKLAKSADVPARSAPIRVASIEPRTTPPRSTTPVGTPAPARRTGGEQSLTRVLGLKLGRVVIDPGHGGHDTGTIGRAGLYEKDLVLDVCRRLGALIERRLGSEVIYTRSDDTFIPLQERTAIANQHRADLFLSIHANSSASRSASGVETYYLNFTSSQSALDVAARENAGSDRSIYDLRDLVQQIALKDKLDESREFASKVQTAMMTLARNANSKSKDRGVRKAPFVVLIGASMPSVLVEIGFLSNPRDESLMQKPAYRQRIAEALYKGVAQYANSLSHFQVARRGGEARN